MGYTHKQSDEICRSAGAACMVAVPTNDSELCVCRPGSAFRRIHLLHRHRQPPKPRPFTLDARRNQGIARLPSCPQILLWSQRLLLLSEWNKVVESYLGTLVTLEPPLDSRWIPRREFFCHCVIVGPT